MRLPEDGSGALGSHRDNQGGPGRVVDRNIADDASAAFVADDNVGGLPVG